MHTWYAQLKYYLVTNLPDGAHVFLYHYVVIACQTPRVNFQIVGGLQVRHFLTSYVTTREYDCSTDVKT